MVGKGGETILQRLQENGMVSYSCEVWKVQVSSRIAGNSYWAYSALRDGLCGLTSRGCIILLWSRRFQRLVCLANDKLGRCFLRGSQAKRVFLGRVSSLEEIGMTEGFSSAQVLVGSDGGDVSLGGGDMSVMGPLVGPLLRP